MMIPSPGRIVEYTLSRLDVGTIHSRRDLIHGEVGNEVYAGDTFPLVITRVWASDSGAAEDSLINGQVLLDASHQLWVTSVAQGEGERTWREYARVSV